MTDKYKILEKYNFHVPRYTSFPPATQFQAVIDKAPVSLSGVGDKISLYIHIPFCAKLCHYCGCNMRVVNNYQPVLDYIDTIKQELLSVRRDLPDNVEISHLHFGGGSPTIIRSGDFARLFHAIGQEFAFDPSMEFSIEADPRNLSEAKIASYARCGVNRISFGVQDFDEYVLNLINRPQPFHVTYRALQLCRTYGITNINFDLMYGLPGQTSATIQKTMDLAISLGPSRISYFGYAHVPWMKRHMNLMPQEKMPSPESRYKLQETGITMLQNAGYIPVGIDHFCLSEDSMVKALNERSLHRNFQGYTIDDAPSLIGLGASSISSFPQGYSQNYSDIRLYSDRIRGNFSPVSRQYILTSSDIIVKKIIETIMCYLQVDLKEIRSEFSLPLCYFGQEMESLKKMQNDGIISLKNDVLTVEADFRALARVVCEVFDPYSIKDMAMQRHALAV